MGGGALLTPLLILFFGFKPTLAVGTDILHGAVFKTFGAVRHRKLGTVHARLTLWMFAASAPMSLLGVQTAEWIEAHNGQPPSRRRSRSAPRSLGGAGFLARRSSTAASSRTTRSFILGTRARDRVRARRGGRLRRRADVRRERHLLRARDAARRWPRSWDGHLSTPGSLGGRASHLPPSTGRGSCSARFPACSGSQLTVRIPERGLRTRDRLLLAGSSCSTCRRPYLPSPSRRSALARPLLRRSPSASRSAATSRTAPIFRHRSARWPSPRCSWHGASSDCGLDAVRSSPEIGRTFAARPRRSDAEGWTSRHREAGYTVFEDVVCSHAAPAPRRRSASSPSARQAVLVLVRRGVPRAPVGARWVEHKVECLAIGASRRRDRSALAAGELLPYALVHIDERALTAVRRPRLPAAVAVARTRAATLPVVARAAHPYRDTDVIDSRAPRFNQATMGFSTRAHDPVAALRASCAAARSGCCSGGGTACRASRTSSSSPAALRRRAARGRSPDRASRTWSASSSSARRQLRSPPDRRCSAPCSAASSPVSRSSPRHGLLHRLRGVQAGVQAERPPVRLVPVAAATGLLGLR